MTNPEFEQEDNLNIELNCETRQQMAGLEQEIEQDENPSSVIETDVDTGGRHLTKPLSKACFTFIAVGAALGVPAIITFSLVNAFLSKPDTQVTKQVTTPVKEEDIGKLKTEVAQIRSKLEAEKLEVESKPKKVKPTPKSPVEAEVPIPKQPEPVAETVEVKAPPPTLPQEPQAPIYIPPDPKPQPIEKERIVKVSTPVNNATPPITVKPTKNPNPVRSWQQVANYGFASYTPKTAISKTPQQSKQRAVQVTASYPAQKARSKVIKKTYALTKEQRIRRHLKNNSLAKSHFKPQKRLQIKSVSAMEAMQPINAEVGKGYGLFINFRQLEEEVTGVLVGDPTAITFHHNNGFVFIRQIKPINFPAITRSADGGTQLVVLTNSQYGSKQYVFRLIPVDKTATYSGIVLKPNQQRLIQPQPTSDFTNTI
jgi:hypothetical protein